MLKMSDFRYKKRCLRCLLALFICFDIIGLLTALFSLGVCLYFMGDEEAFQEFNSEQYEYSDYGEEKTYYTQSDLMMFTIMLMIVVAMRAWIAALFLKMYNGFGEHDLKKVARCMRLSVMTFCFGAVLSFFAFSYVDQLGMWLAGVFWGGLVFGLCLWYASTWLRLGKELKLRNISI